MAEEQQIQEAPEQAQQDAPGGDPGKLSDADRDRLAGIVQKMKANGESDDNITTAVGAFKQKYASASPAPSAKIAPLDTKAYDKIANIPSAVESTAGGSTAIKQNIASAQANQDHAAKIQAKYKPLLDKSLSDIEAHRRLYVENKRPSLDFHHDAPDSFYDVPKMSAIDDYLKANYPDADTRYYLRNKIISSFQNNKDAYHIEQSAQQHISQIPAVQQARLEVNKDISKPEDTAAVMQRARQIDPTVKDQVNTAYEKAAKSNEDIKNETSRMLMNNSTSLSYDEDGNLKKVNTLDPNTPFHDQITGAGKAVQGIFNFAGDVGSMASGVLKFFQAKDAANSLQTLSDDFKTKNAFPGGDQTVSEFAAGNVLPMLLQGEAMGRLAHGIGAPVFKALSGASARGLIGKATEGALGGVALAPINSALISHDYYTSLVKGGEAPEIAHAKAERVFDKNLVTDMAISPVQFGIMNAPVSGAGRALLQYGVSPAIAGAHFMAQDYFQAKENNPALTAWQYATSPEGMKTGITGALTGLLQHYAIGKMNDWQNEKSVKDAFSFGRKDASPETAGLPNKNVLASTVLNAFEMKDHPKRATELSGLVDDLHQKGVYNEQEAEKINGIIKDVAAVKDQVPKMGTSAQRMAVFNELLNKKSYQDQMASAGAQPVADMLEEKMKDSDERIKKIMNEEEPLYFINGIETSKEQLTQWAKENPDLVKSKSVKIDVIGDDPTKEAIKNAKADEQDPVQESTPETPGTPVESKITEVRHAVTPEDDNGVTSGPTGVKLSEEGRQKAGKMGDDLQGAGIGKVISSALPRAVETAQIVAEKLGIPHEQMPELNSWDIGEFDKMKDTEFKKAEKFFVENPDAKEFDGKKINESFNDYKDRVIAARQKVEDDNEGHTLIVNHGGNINAHDAFVKNGNEFNDQASKDYLNAKDTPPAELPADMPPNPETGNKTLPGRTPEFSDFYHSFKGEVGSVSDSSFDFRLDTPQPQKDREGAVKDIDAGKNSKRAKLFLDELQRQFDSGTMEYTRGRGNHVEKFGIPVKEWIETNNQAQAEVLKDIEEGHISDPELLKWLQEEADKTYNDESEQPSQAGSATGEREAGDKDAELLPAIRAGDEAKTGAGKTADENEPRSADDRAAGPVRKVGAPEGGKPVQDESGATAEEDVKEVSELKADLAARLGTPALAKLGEEGSGEHKPFESPASALKEISDHYKKDPLITRVVDFLKPIIDANPSIRFDNEYDFSDKPGIGYSEADGRIALKYDALGSKDDLYRTALHEMMHAATRSEIEHSAAFKEDLRDVLTEIRKALKVPDSDGLIPLLVQKGIIPDEKYGTANEHELIAEVFSNQKFNDMLRGIDYKGDSMLKRVFLKIAQYFNGKYKALVTAKGTFSADNMADYLMKLTESVIKGSGQDSAGSLAMIGKPSGNPLEDFVREKLDEHKEPSIKKALVDTGGMKDTDAQALIDKIRNERTQTPEEIIRDAMAMGKAAKKTPIASQQQTQPLKSGISKTLRRWYADGVDDVSDVKSIIRKNKGNEEFNIDKIFHETKKLVNFWNTVPAVKQMAFMLGVEKPELLASQPQNIRDIADSYKDRLDKTFQIITAAMPNLNFVQDYFPHFWEKPDEMRNHMANTLLKAPLEGGKSFAKKRFFETIVSGLQAGYKLSTTNPEEIVRLAEANAWKFKTARDILGDMDAKGLIQMAPMGEGPAGWQTVKDPAFQNMAMRMKSFKSGDSKMAALYMPPDVAKLMNDYLSIGVKGPIKDFVQQYNNIKNLFQLGVGFFHVGTTSLDAMVSGMTNGIQKIFAGNPKGLLDMATLGNLPATISRGFKARSDWNKGIVTADTQALMDANAKIGRQKMYSLDAKYNMMKAFGRLRADGDFSQIPKIAWNAMLYLPEAINKPLMEHYVPSLKVGGYLRALDSEIASRKKMTPEELQNAKQKIWDSMDDRLGQVVYDNIFMNKTYKDMALMAVRSAGWTGGTIRAVSGGLAEIPRSGARLVKGEGLSQRTAYLIALPLTVGVMGAMYQYLLTGKPPEEPKDYFFPKDGTTSPDGTDHRVDFPSYMKDIAAYSKHPVQTLLHKTAPLLNEAVELYSNKDFYGEKIINSDDPVYQKGLDILKYEGQSMVPFSFKKNPNDERPFSDQVTTRPGLEQKFGIMAAPKERERSDIQNAITKAYQEQIGTKEEGKTHAEMEQLIARKHLKEFIFNGGDYKDASDEWKDKAGLKPHSVQKFIHDSQTDPYERYFKQLTPDRKITLWNTMNEEDQAKYGKWIPAKDRNQLTPEQ